MGVTVRVSRKLLAALPEVAGLLVGAVALAILGLGVDRPITFPDELIYSELGRSFSSNFSFHVAGTPLSVWTYGPVYPILLAPIYSLAHNAHSAYVAVRVLNAIAFASAGIPVYRLARRLVSRRSALLAGALTVLVPASVYSTKIETENIAFPFAMWVLFLLLEAAEGATARRQLALVALLVLSPLVRFEFVALFAAAAAVALFGSAGAVRVRARTFAPLLCGIGVAGVAAVVAAAVHSSVQARGIGDHGSLSVGALAAQLAANLAAIDLYVGIVPFVFLAAALLALRVRGPGRLQAELRPLVVLAGSFTASLVLVAAAYFASIGRGWRPVVPSDRYVFYAAPLMWVLFLRCLEDGVPRRGVRIVAPLAALLPLIVGATQIHGPGLVATSSGLAYMPWMFMRALTPKGSWLALLACYCVFAAAVAAFRGRRFARRWVVASSVITTAFAFAYVSFGAWYARHHSPPAGWLDARVTGPVVGVWGTTPTRREALAMWSVATTNQALRAVYYVQRPDTLGPSMKGRVGRGGELWFGGRVLRPRYVLTSSRTRFAGVAIAEAAGLTLYRVTGPLRVVRVTAGQAPASQPSIGLKSRPVAADDPRRL